MFVLRSWISILHQISFSRSTDMRARNRAEGANQIKYAFSCNFFIFWRNLTYNSSKDWSLGDKKDYCIKWHGRCFGMVNILLLSMVDVFGVVNALARSMFWCCRWCGAVNIMALSMIWPGQYFITVDVLAQSHICRRATIPEGPQISTSPVHWKHQNTDRAETSTTP